MEEEGHNADYGQFYFKKVQLVPAKRGHIPKLRTEFSKKLYDAMNELAVGEILEISLLNKPSGRIGINIRTMRGRLLPKLFHEYKRGKFIYVERMMNMGADENDIQSRL